MNNCCFSLPSFLALVLGMTLGVAPSPSLAQTPTPESTFRPQPTSAKSLAQSLKIFVLEGEGAVNSISRRAATAPVVEVRDENDLPVEGAEVVFELPALGPGGVFPGGEHKYTTRTNLQGQARAPFLMNDEPGSFRINITAQIGDRVGRTSISQTNSVRAEEEGVRLSRPWYKRWQLWAIAGGAAAAVTAVLVARGDGSSGPTITINPGSPTFGGPR